MIIALLLQAASPPSPTVTLAEAHAMSPAALAERLLPEREHGPVVDAIINGRSPMMAPSLSVNWVWLTERMVPYDATLCRSHIFYIEMGAGTEANIWKFALPTHPVTIREYDELWVPPAGAASVATCAAAPPRTSGFGDAGLGLRQTADLVEQARSAFALAAKRHDIAVTCRGERGACRHNPRRTLAEIDWSSLGFMEQVSPDGKPYFDGNKPKDTGWGPAHVQFTFPYMASDATWIITVDRKPDITAVRMDAQIIIFH